MKVAIITEGFRGTGYGHLTRCLSLYQAFEEKKIIPLYVANCDENGEKFVDVKNFLRIDWLNNPEILLDKINGYDIIVIDSYLAPLSVYEKIQSIARTTIYIDDYIRLKYPWGIILNGTIGAENMNYNRDKDHLYLLGMDYMPLRKEFWDIDIPVRQKKYNNILVTFGAQDPRNLTEPVLEKLNKEFPGLNYHVVTGPGNIIGEKERASNIKFYSSLSASQMADLMLECDLAVTAAGQTTYELARTGVPFIAIGVIDNQEFNLKGWAARGYIENILWYEQNDLYDKLIYNVNNIISGISSGTLPVYDGQGARRVVNKVLDENFILN